MYLRTPNSKLVGKVDSHLNQTQTPYVLLPVLGPYGDHSESPRDIVTSFELRSSPTLTRSDWGPAGAEAIEVLRLILLIY
jgi:hypothetical protein